MKTVRQRAGAVGFGVCPERLTRLLPFDGLRRRSRIYDAAKAAGDAPDLTERIRTALPAQHPGE